MTKRVPIGVCGLITAWNSPAAIIAWKMFPALICGNTVVIKPSEDAPLTAHFICTLVDRAGIPPGVVNVVHGIGPTVGKALVDDDRVKVVSFTGSTRVGSEISEKCGYRMKRCSLELGGKNGVIVMDDVDLSKVYDKFMEMLLDETNNMEIGMPDDPETKVPPIINEKQYRSIVGYIERAEAGGAINARTRHHWTTQDGARFVSPAIFTGVEWSSEVAREEIFGPVLVVFKIRSLVEAIDMLNRSDYGLTASIYTRNVNDAMKAVDLLKVGVCYVNAPTFGSEPHMPFGGVKASGNGTREPGVQSLDVFSDWKTVYIDYNA
jgi:aldehyde dehydrogenase (NAD+)